MIAPAEKYAEPRRSPGYVKDASGLWADIPAFTAFAQEVYDALEGSELRYSQRQRLLKRASTFGLRSFDANLIIAMVQNRASKRAPAAPKQSSKFTVIAFATVFLAVQSAILAAGWWLVS